MIKQLDIVKGGVAKKDLTPILKHLRIHAGWITSTNGRLTISTPLPQMKDLSIIVPAEKFIIAIKTCNEPRFNITPSGKLSIQGKKFRALLPLMVDVVFPSPSIAGNKVISHNLISVIKKLIPFVGDDASRPWAGGILLYQNMAYATNNVIVAKCPVEWDSSAVNLPSFLLAELLRLKKDIVQIISTGQTITFELEDQIWLNSVLLSVKWPNVKEIISKVSFDSLTQTSNDLCQAVEDIIPFCPDKKFLKIKFTDRGITTDSGDQEARVEIENLHPSVWRAEPLLKLLQESKSQSLSSDFTQWPGPCPWRREDGVEGLIIGLKT